MRRGIQVKGRLQERITDLEAALLDFPGTLVLVSHDRYLVKRTTAERLELG